MANRDHLIIREGVSVVPGAQVAESASMVEELEHVGNGQGAKTEAGDHISQFFSYPLRFISRWGFHPHGAKFNKGTMGKFVIYQLTSEPIT